MAAKTKLELTWIGKENRPRLEPRILIEEERLSHHAVARRDGDHFDNIPSVVTTFSALKRWRPRMRGA